MRRKPIINYLFLTIYVILSTIPILWLIFISLKTNQTVFANILSFPDKLHFENYYNVWKNLKLGRFFFNTIFISIMSTIVTLMFTTFASFVISRFDFRYKNRIYFYLLAGLAVPTYVAVYPLFIASQALHVYDSQWLLILVYAGWAIPISILIQVGFMKNIPKEFEEAAVIDGANIYYVFTKIVLPLAKPAIFTVITIIFLLNFWNEYMLSSVLIADPIRRTINVALASAIAVRGTNYVDMSAAVILVLIPEIILFLVFQKSIIEGMTFGGIKE